MHPQLLLTVSRRDFPLINLGLSQVRDVGPASSLDHLALEQHCLPHPRLQVAN